MNIEEIENKLAGYFSTRPEIEVGYIFGSRRSGKENKLEHGLQIAIQSLIDIGGPLMKYHKVICLAVVMLLGFAGKISAQQLGEALDDSTYTWVTGGNADWFGQTAVSYFGGDAVQSGAIGNSSQTYIQTVVTGPVNAGFYYKVSSEEGADFLRLYIDGALTASWSGEVNWTAGSYYVASGTHAVKFVYQKDGTISSGSDAAWVDYFTISPETYPPGKPLNFTATGGGLQAGLSWTAPGNDGYTGDVSSGAYEIRYSSTSGSTPLTAQYAVTISSAWVQGSTNTYSITGLWPESAYYFWIKAKDEAGNWSVWSDTASAIPSGFTDINAGLTGVYLASLSWGDYDNDGDLDLALAGYTGSAWISKIYRSGYSQLQTNSAPSKPISGFTAQPDYNTAKLTLDWNASTDAETPALGLHYEIIMSTVDMNANPAWRPYVVSVTSGAGTGTGGWQNIGNYPHGFISAAHQPGMILSSFQENTTYYWKVRAIDTGLAKSSWSVQQASFIPYAPPSVASISPNSRIKAIYSYSNTLAAGADYTYYFEALDSSGAVAAGAPTSAVAAPDVAGARQQSFKTTLGDNFFNPRTGGTSKIKFNVPAAGRVSLKIYNLAGKPIRALFEGDLNSGDTQREWDGRDDSGRYAAPSVYFLHYVYPGGKEVRKIGVKK